MYRKSFFRRAFGFDKMPSVFCAYCKRQGHVISDCPVLKARKESKLVVAYTSAESSFKQDLMPSGFSHCPQMGNGLYQSPSSKDFTCSSLTNRDYVPLSGDSMPVHQDLMPVHQDLTPVYQDSMPVHQDFTPVYQDYTPVLQDLTPACQHFMPVCQDSTPFIKIIRLFIRISCLLVKISCLLLRIYPLSKTFVLHQTQFLRFISLLF